MTNKPTTKTGSVEELVAELEEHVINCWGQNPNIIDWIELRGLFKDTLTHLQEQTRREERSKLFKLIRPIFEDWAGNSQYVTGSWNSGDYVDSDKKDKYWQFVRKTAWEQFASMLDEKLAAKPLDSQESEVK